MTKLSDALSLQAEVLGLSARQISARAKDAGYTLNNKTASNYLAGRHGRPDTGTLEALAHVLRLETAALRDLAGEPPAYGKYDPPPFSDQMTLEQRRVVDETIRLFVRGNTGEHESEGPRPADLSEHRRRQEQADALTEEQIRKMAAYEPEEESLGRKIDEAYQTLGEESQVPPDEDQRD